MVYDLFSAEFKADPFPTFAEMRVNAPIYAHRDRSGRTIWYITRYADVIAIMRDTRFVKDPTRAQPPKPASRTKQQPSLQQAINRNMLFSDPPDHTRLRALVNLAFTPRRVERMADQVQRAIVVHQPARPCREACQRDVDRTGNVRGHELARG